MVIEKGEEPVRRFHLLVLLAALLTAPLLGLTTPASWAWAATPADAGRTYAVALPPAEDGPLAVGAGIGPQGAVLRSLGSVDPAASRAPGCRCAGETCPARESAAPSDSLGKRLAPDQFGTLGLGFLAGIAAADLVTTGGVGTMGMLMKGGISALAVMSLGELQDQLGIRKEDLYGAGMGVLAGIALADLIGTGGLGTAAVIGIGGLVGRFVAHDRHADGR